MIRHFVGDEVSVSRISPTPDSENQEEIVRIASNERLNEFIDLSAGGWDELRTVIAMLTTATEMHMPQIHMQHFPIPPGILDTGNPDDEGGDTE